MQMAKQYKNIINIHFGCFLLIVIACFIVSYKFCDTKHHLLEMQSKIHSLNLITQNKTKMNIIKKHRLSNITINDFEEFLIQQAEQLHINIVKCSHKTDCTDSIHKTNFNITACVLHEDDAFDFLSAIENDFVGFCFIYDIKIARASKEITQSPALLLEYSCTLYHL